MSDALDQWIHQLWYKSDLVLPPIYCLTVHQTQKDQSLALRSCVGIKDNIVPHIQKIPFGKGMAGFALQHKYPAMSCNLQTKTHPQQASSVQQMTAYQGIAYPILDPFCYFNQKVLHTLMQSDQHQAIHQDRYECIAIFGIAFTQDFKVTDQAWYRIAQWAATAYSYL
jgi:hypothetical protein